MLLSQICPISFLVKNFVPNLSHWRFPQHRPSIVNQDTNTVNSVPLNVQPTFCPQKLIIHNKYIWVHPLLVDMQSPSGTKQENPIATSNYFVPGLATPVFQPTYPYVWPSPLSWSGSQVSAPVSSITDNVSLINELADAITIKKNDPLPEFFGNPLERNGQIKSAIDSQSLNDDIKLTYLKILVTGKEKMAIAEFA